MSQYSRYPVLTGGGGGGGTVTSVGITSSDGLINVSNSPIHTSGNIVLAIDHIPSGIVTNSADNAFAGFDASGNLNPIPNWNFNPGPQTGYGLGYYPTIDTAPDAGSANYYPINAMNVTITPSASTVNQNPEIFNPSVTIDPTNTGFNINSVYVTNAFNSFQGSGTITNFGLDQQFLDFSGTGTITFAELDSKFIHMHSGSHGGDISVYNAGVEMDSGAAITNSYTGFQENSNFASGSTSVNHTGLNLTPQLQGTITGQVFGVNVNPNMTGTGIPQWTGINVNPNNTSGATIPNLTGINIDLSNMPSINQKQGLNINGASIGVSAVLDTSITPPSGEFQMNGLGGTFTIASGSPITNGAFGFGNNLACNLIANDNMGADATGLGIGFAINGFVNEVAIAAGKTVDSVNYMMAGGGVAPGSSGTITNATMFYGAGFLPEGGTLSVTNMYGFKTSTILSSMATNTWGVYVPDTGAENFFQKSLAIGTSDGKVSNASTALEVGSLKAILLARLTTTQKLALTALAGMVVYDTTLNQMSYYNGTTWVNV